MRNRHSRAYIRHSGAQSRRSRGGGNPSFFAAGIVACVLAVLILAALACGQTTTDAEPTPTSATREPNQAPAPTPTPDPIPAVLDSSASLLPTNSLIAQVAVTLDTPARVLVEYGNPDAGRFRTAPTQSEDTQHVVPVLRLRPESTYRFQVFVIDGDGREHPGAQGAFTTGGLPEALQRMDLTSTGRPTAELVLFDYEDNPESFYVALDQDMHVVWYYPHVMTVPEEFTSARTVRQKPDFNLVFLEGGPLGRRFNCCMKEITPLGELVDRLVNNEIDKWVNRDIQILDNYTVLYLANEIIEIDDTASGGDPETQVLVDSIRIWDQRTHTTREVWSALDTLSLDVRPRWSGDLKNWLRANSLDLGPRDNYIVSLANRNQVISVSPDGERIEWKLGGPNGGYKFLDPADKFYGQHTASEMPNGNILVFDNGQGRPEEEGGEYSRALELTLNTYDLSAIKVWEYRHTPDLYARGRSSAFRMPNGNTIINFETNEVDPPRVIVEADGDGNAVWTLELRSPSLRNSFRAYTIDSISGESRVER